MGIGPPVPEPKSTTVQEALGLLCWEESSVSCREVSIISARSSAGVEGCRRERCLVQRAARASCWSCLMKGGILQIISISIRLSTIVDILID